MNKSKWKKIMGILATTLGTTYAVITIVAKKKKAKANLKINRAR